MSNAKKKHSSICLSACKQECLTVKIIQWFIPFRFLLPEFLLQDFCLQEQEIQVGHIALMTVVALLVLVIVDPSSREQGNGVSDNGPSQS